MGYGGQNYKKFPRSEAAGDDFVKTLVRAYEKCHNVSSCFQLLTAGIDLMDAAFKGYLRRFKAVFWWDGRAYF
jgi:hypothetical protein